MAVRIESGEIKSTGCTIVRDGNITFIDQTVRTPYANIVRRAVSTLGSKSRVLTWGTDLRPYGASLQQRFETFEVPSLDADKLIKDNKPAQLVIVDQPDLSLTKEGLAKLVASTERGGYIICNLSSLPVDPKFNPFLNPANGQVEFVNSDEGLLEVVLFKPRKERHPIQQIKLSRELAIRKAVLTEIYRLAGDSDKDAPLSRAKKVTYLQLRRELEGKQLDVRALLIGEETKSQKLPIQERYGLVSKLYKALVHTIQVGDGKLPLQQMLDEIKRVLMSRAEQIILWEDQFLAIQHEANWKYNNLTDEQQRVVDGYRRFMSVHIQQCRTFYQAQESWNGTPTLSREWCNFSPNISS